MGKFKGMVQELRESQVGVSSRSRSQRESWQLSSRFFSDDQVDELVEQHMPLVRRIARRYSQYQPDSYDDLIQVGSIGLLKAIGYYDPERARSASFKTLATCYIRGEIRHYLRDHASIVQVPRKLTEINTQVSQLEEKLAKTLERSPTVEELSRYSGFSVEDILDAQQSRDARLHYESLDASGDDEEREDRRALSEAVADRKYQELLRMSEDREVLSNALKGLGEKTRQIVEFVFFYDLSQKETAVVLGLSEMGVSRAVHSALSRLREILGNEGMKVESKPGPEPDPEPDRQRNPEQTRERDQDQNQLVD